MPDSMELSALRTVGGTYVSPAGGSNHLGELSDTLDLVVKIISVRTAVWSNDQGTPGWIEIRAKQGRAQVIWWVFASKDAHLWQGASPGQQWSITGTVAKHHYGLRGFQYETELENVRSR